MEKLKIIRKEKGMTQKELSIRSDVKLGSIQHYEQGYRDLKKADAYTVFKLAIALGCDMEELIN